MAEERADRGERKARIASAFCFAEMACRVAGIGASGDRSAVIRKEKDKWCVRSPNNPDWSGGCYDTKGEAEERLKQVEAAKHAKASAGDDWVPAAGGMEEPFLTRDGRRLLYVWNPKTGKHAYLDLGTDLVLSDEEARHILGSSGGLAGITYKSAPEYKSVEDFVEYKMDDLDDEFDHEDLAALSCRMKSSPGKVRKQLESYGLKLKKRETEKKSRGFQSPDHDRWFGPGAEPTHGGGGAGSKWIPSTFSSQGLRSPSSPGDAVPLTDSQETGAHDAGYEAASYLHTSGRWSGDADSVFLWAMETDVRVPFVTEDDPSFWEWHEAVRNGASDYARSAGLDLR